MGIHGTRHRERKERSSARFRERRERERERRERYRSERGKKSFSTCKREIVRESMCVSVCVSELKRQFRRRK